MRSCVDNHCMYEVRETSPSANHTPQLPKHLFLSFKATASSYYTLSWLFFPAWLRDSLTFRRGLVLGLIKSWGRIKNGVQTCPWPGGTSCIHFVLLTWGSTQGLILMAVRNVWYLYLLFKKIPGIYLKTLIKKAIVMTRSCLIWCMRFSEDLT